MTASPAAVPRIVEPWPALPIAAWRDTCATLHLWTQIVGKIRLALTPKVNQWWNVPLYVTTRGLTTSVMPYAERGLSLDFDFVDHELRIDDTQGHVRALPLFPRTVADFYRELFAVLTSIGVDVHIRPHPVECPVTTKLDEDMAHGAYDAAAAHDFWRVLRKIEPVFEQFRARFRGKCSPVHFFWGSFDLAVSRFSGRRAPLRTSSIIERDAYDEEVSSLGFWPGDEWSEGGKDASFYSYMVPEPAGYSSQRIRPAGAYYDTTLKEFLLPYEVARRAPSPADAILEFAQSTYEAGAQLANWDVAALAYP